MRKNKNLLKRAAAIAAMSTMIVSQAPLVSAFAYGEYDVSSSTFKNDTDNSTDFQSWLANVWQGGEKAFAKTENIALVPGSDASALNFHGIQRVKEHRQLRYGKTELSQQPRL